MSPGDADRFAVDATAVASIGLPDARVPGDRVCARCWAVALLLIRRDLVALVDKVQKSLRPADCCGDRVDLVLVE